MQTKRRIKLTYPPALVDQPVVYSLIKQFDLVTNIREANVDSEEAWLVIDLEGSTASVEQALAWAREQGMTVEVLRDED
jgi:ABC-type methionine transport system ATPase subunit